jgi:hypothetical protein
MFKKLALFGALVAGLAVPVQAQTVKRHGPGGGTGLKPKVFGIKATASSSYGRGYMPEDALGKPNIFPRYGDQKGAWTCKSKTSKSDWLEVEFPPTMATHLIVYETERAGAITKVVVQGRVVFQGKALGKRFGGREGQAFIVTFATSQVVSRVRIFVDASAVGGWPEIDSMALVGTPSEKAAPVGDVASVRIIHPPVRGRDWGVGKKELARAYQEITPSILAALNAKLSAGDTKGARFYLWGLWTQTKLDRYDAQERLGKQGSLKAIQAIDARFQQARDLIFGSTPPLETGDDAVVLETLIGLIPSALNADDLTTAKRILGHARARIAAGVKVSPEFLKKANAAVGAFNTKEQKLTKAFNELGIGVMNASPTNPKLWSLRDGFTRLHSDQKGLNAGGRSYDRVNDACRDIYRAVNKSRAALHAFVLSSGDPEWVDAFLLKNPKMPSRRFVDACRAAVYGPALLESWNFPDLVIQYHFAKADSNIVAAEGRFQSNNSSAAKANLARARTSIDAALELGADAADVEQRRAAIKEALASAGSGKLKRVERILADVKKKLGKARRAHDIAWPEKILGTADGWIAKAVAEGITLEAVNKTKSQVAAAKLWIPATYARLAQVSLASAGRYVGVAKEKLKGQDAFTALSPLKSAERDLEEAKQLAAMAGVQQATLRAQVSGYLSAVEDLRGQSLTAQRMYKDIYTGSGGSSWRGTFKSLAKRERGWDILRLTLVRKDWVNKSSTWEYEGGGSTRIRETRWYRKLYAMVAIPDPENKKQVQLILVGFQLHKMTDGSYRRLKIFHDGTPILMLRENLSK